jgi:ABC-2 type transport system ATP-binding protein
LVGLAGVGLAGIFGHIFGIVPMLSVAGGITLLAGVIALVMLPTGATQDELVEEQEAHQLPPIDSFVLNREIYEVPDAQFRATLSELVDLQEIGDVLNVQVRRLSLGQRMKCELVAALLHRPCVLFLDEPTIGLDVVVQKRLRGFLRLYNARYGTTVLLTSHYMDDVEELCRRVMVINYGQLVFDGAMASLVERFATTKYITVVFGQPVDRTALAAFGAVVAYDGGLTATLAVPRAEHSRQAASLLNTYQVDDLDIRDPGLEEVIAHVFGDGATGARTTTPISAPKAGR